MQRICTSLASSGFDILLIGRQLKQSLPLTTAAFQQKRISCLFNTGILFYSEYNLRLFFVLLRTRADILCAIDLDTILPCLAASVLRGKKRVYDAHELFTEQKEIVTRPFIHKCWLAIEKCAVPRYKYGYTVNQFIAEELQRRYHVRYGIVRNLPLYTSPAKAPTEKFIIYQGAVNEGRSFETLIPAMQQVHAKLIIYGKGNFFNQVQQLIANNKLEDKIELKGHVTPDKLKQITPTASVALTIFESTGLNQYYSLSNRFFDYIMAGVPQVCVNYPEYKAINDVYDIAIMIDDVQPATIAAALNKLLTDEVLYARLQQHCIKAAAVLNWQEEEKKLIAFYNQLVKD